MAPLCFSNKCDLLAIPPDVKPFQKISPAAEKSLLLFPQSAYNNKTKNIHTSNTTGYISINTVLQLALRT